MTLEMLQYEFMGLEILQQGDHKRGKHGKPVKRREFEKLSESQGNSGKFNFFWKNLENSGKT